MNSLSFTGYKCRGAPMASTNKQCWGESSEVRVWTSSPCFEYFKEILLKFGKIWKPLRTCSSDILWYGNVCGSVVKI